MTRGPNDGNELRKYRSGTKKRGFSKVEFLQNVVSRPRKQKIPKDIGTQQCMWHSECHGQARRTFLQKFPSENPLLWFSKPYRTSPRPLHPTFSPCFTRSGNEGALGFPGATWDRSRCTMESTPNRSTSAQGPTQLGPIQKQTRGEFLQFFFLLPTKQLFPVRDRCKNHVYFCSSLLKCLILIWLLQER